MKNFLLGIATGLVAGGGILLAVHPMSKREMKKAWKRAGKMMNRMNCKLHEAWD